MKLTINEAVASVQNAPGSMYTREDVLSLLNKLNAPSADLSELVDAIKSCIKDNMDNLDNSCIDYSSAEFSMSHNEVQLDDVQFDTRVVRDIAIEGIEDVIVEFFQQLENEEDTDA